MCDSASCSFDARVRVELAGQLDTGTSSLKILSITLDKDCSFHTHVDNVKRRFRTKTWALASLMKKGLSEKNLVMAYTGLIRPTAEYASTAWNSMISPEQSESVERQQTQALKNIFGYGISAAKLHDRAGLPTLFKRREDFANRFAKKNLENPRCSGWFVERTVSSYIQEETIKCILNIESR